MFSEGEKKQLDLSGFTLFQGFWKSQEENQE